MFLPFPSFSTHPHRSRPPTFSFIREDPLILKVSLEFLNVGRGILCKRRERARIFFSDLLTSRETHHLPPPIQHCPLVCPSPFSWTPHPVITSGWVYLLSFESVHFSLLCHSQSPGHQRPPPASHPPAATFAFSNSLSTWPPEWFPSNVQIPNSPAQH